MADATLPTGPIQIVGSAECVAKPGSVRLDSYKLLAYAPEQYPGRGVVTEDNGTSVYDVVYQFSLLPDTSAVATKLATTPDHVRQAIDYAVEAGLAQATTSTEENAHD